MVRYHRMKGIPTLWVPGSDHASIATQLQVEKSLTEEGLTREEIGREAFLERSWLWRDKFGRIINISSLAQDGCSGQANYAASKAGLIGLSNTIGREYGIKGITSNVVTVGYVQTDMTGDHLAEKLHEVWMKYCPMQRIGTADEIAGMVHYLTTENAGFINGEIYGSVSTDNGATWSNYVNLTNTRSPGAAAGNCADEDYFTVAPKTFDFGSGEQVFITYIEDKDAGAYVHTEGVETENPVRCWVFPVPGVEEHNNTVPVTTALTLYPNPTTNGSSVSYALTRSGNMSLSLFDASGRLVTEIEKGSKVAGTYDVDLDVRELANGTYFVVLDTPAEKVSRSLVIMH